MGYLDVFSLAGRTAVVTGANRGIGAATARALDGAGARVALVARDAALLGEVATTLANDPVVLAGDLGDPDEPARIAQRALDAFGGRVDVLVNNAAVAVRQPSDELDAATIDRLLGVNVRGLLLLTAALLPSMVGHGRGSIINLSSVSGNVGTPRRAAYAATKAAVDGLTRSLAMEYGRHGIRVNSVAPGAVVTQLWERNRAIPGVIEGIEAQTALARWAEPEDIADVIVFLASDASRFLTAETVHADGGMAMTLDLYGGAV